MASLPVPPPAEEAVRGALLGVIDPELGDNVVDLGMVRRVEVGPEGAVDVTVALTTAGCPLRAQLMKDVKLRVGSLPGVSDVRVHFGEMTEEQRKSLMARARWKARENPPATDIPPTTRIAAIASGKGGVGKSSITVNLAVQLARRGLTVGVLDADIGGFSIPRMLGLDGQLGAEGKKIVPLEKRIGEGRLKVVSMGSVGNAAEDQAIMWRGFMLNRAVQQFLEDVRWGDLDYLLIDMPPGTGDVALSMAQYLSRSEMFVVTTPQAAAQRVAQRTAYMARKVNLPLRGVIENMSWFTGDDGKRYELFGAGGGAALAEALGVPLLGRVPLVPALREGGDVGVPVTVSDPGGEAGQAFAAMAEAIVAMGPARIYRSELKVT